MDDGVFRFAADDVLLAPLSGPTPSATPSKCAVLMRLVGSARPTFGTTAHVTCSVAPGVTGSIPACCRNLPITPWQIRVCRARISSKKVHHRASEELSSSTCLIANDGHWANTRAVTSNLWR